MKKPSARFIISVTVLTLLCVALQFVWNGRVEPEMQLRHGLLLLAIFPLSITAIHTALLQSADEPQGFVRKYMLTTVLKFFAYIVVLFAFLYMAAENKKVLALHFLFYYLVFTILEATLINADLKKHGKK